MVAGEVESSYQLVVTFFFFFFSGLTLPNYRNKSGSLLPPPLVRCSAVDGTVSWIVMLVGSMEEL